MPLPAVGRDLRHVCHTRELWTAFATLARERRRCLPHSVGCLVLKHYCNLDAERFLRKYWDNGYSMSRTCNFVHTKWVEFGHFGSRGFLAAGSLPACQDLTVNRNETQLAAAAVVSLTPQSSAREPLRGLTADRSEPAPAEETTSDARSSCRVRASNRPVSARLHPACLPT
jgi:hypothetical protein